MKGVAAGAWRVAVSVTCLSLTLGLIGALCSPGYRDPVSWGLPATRPAPPREKSPDAAVTERVVELIVRGERVNALLVSPAQPHAALVMVHGSGSGDMRDGHDLMAVMASRGVAVLSPSKLMAGYSPLTRDYAQLGDDASDAARWLRQETHLDASRVGLLGRSEGGWVSLLAACRHPELGGPVVLDSAPVITPLEQSAYIATGRGRAGSAVSRRLITGLLAAGRPLVNYLDTDVRPALPRVTNTVIAVFGDSDPQVPATQAIALLRDGLPQPPVVILAPGGHLPPPQAWAPTATQALVTTHPTGSVWTVSDARPDPSSTGAPTPPAPSPLLDPRWHLALAALLLLGHRYVRSTKPRTQEVRP